MYPDFSEEKKLWRQGYEFVVGLDESGRGPLAGPVVAAAVCVKNIKREARNSRQYQNYNFKNAKFVFNSDIMISNLLIKDSKQLSKRKRQELFEILTKHRVIGWGIGVVSENMIDKINILEATRLAMKKAVENLRFTVTGLRFESEFLLIDGNFRLNNIKIPQKSIIKGDQKVFSIAAAGIVAKVARDRMMERFHKKYPEYGFDSHKGYGTKLHIKNLQSLGPCKIHRKTFYPVSALVKREII